MGIETDSEEYAVPDSNDAPVSIWLKLVYIFVPIWGIVSLVLYWNGSWGWLDRGYWKELQIAANTTFPAVNQNQPDVPETEEGNKEQQEYP